MPRFAQRLGLLTIAVVVVAGLDPAGLGGGAAQAEESPFTALEGFDLAEVADPRVAPEQFAAVDVDLAGLRADLADAPRTQGRRVTDGGLTVAVPRPEGGTERFAVQRTRLMEPALAAAHPEITTYAGRGVDDPTLTVALDVTPMGFHASVRSPAAQRAWFVDPAVNERGTSEHLVYYGSAVDEPVGGLVEPEEVRPAGSGFDADRAARASRGDAVPGGPVTQKVYRVALVSDPSYAAYFGTANVLAEKVTLMNRVNQVYNDDLAISMVLVDESEALNLDTEAKATGANGPCGTAPCYHPGTAEAPGDLDGCSGTLLGKNRTVLGQLVGADDYDIGHIVLGKNGGGIAYLGVVGADYKGGGCTGLPFPEGDFFAIDYVAHEMGHQFAGPHTFDGTEGACSGGNRTAETSVEPGSGSSVMAYAGICDTDDLQPHTDPYFSQRTIDNVTDYTTPGVVDDVVEVQTVSLRGFDTDGDTVTLAFGDATTTLTRGAATYNAVTVRAAIAELTDRPLAQVTIAEWGYDPFDSAGPDLAPVLAPDDRGFQVIFSASTDPEDPTAVREDVAPLSIPDAAEGFVGTTAQGGPAANAGDDRVATANTAPVVTAPADRTLPVRTPFALTASGTDSDGDRLTYLWEQNDEGSPLGGTALVDNLKTTGPLFRVFGRAAEVSLEDSLESPSPGQNVADGTPTRVFPDLAQVLDGTTNADSGRCPEPPAADPANPEPLAPDVRECFSEFLPTGSYTGAGAGDPTDPAMTFRVTARDGYALGGGTAHDDVRLSIDPTAGPFRVTSQAEGTTLAAGSTQQVTWAVNGTEDLASDVRITMSTDGGATWGEVLADSTPNDGSARVEVPAVSTDEARIRVEARDNYFFDVNDAAFAVAPVPETTITDGPPAGGFSIASPVEVAYSSSDGDAQFECTLDGEPLDCPPGGVDLADLEPGTHRFTVAARDADGVVDPTPAVRRWSTPLGVDDVQRSAGWTRYEAAGAYRGAYLRTTRAGAEVTVRDQGMARLAVVVLGQQRSGRVAVFLNGDRLRTINLAAERFRGRTVVALPPLDRPRSGLVRVRALDGGAPVRLEGIGVLDR